MQCVVHFCYINKCKKRLAFINRKSYSRPHLFSPQRMFSLSNVLMCQYKFYQGFSLNVFMRILHLLRNLVKDTVHYIVHSITPGKRSIKKCFESSIREWFPISIFILSGRITFLVFLFFCPLFLVAKDPRNKINITLAFVFPLSLYIQVWGFYFYFSLI